MRARSASSTAQLVTLLRALADDGATSVPGFHDPFAAPLLSGGYRAALAWGKRRYQAFPAGAERARAAAPFDAVPIRTAVIDRLLESAVAQGCRQVVLLGAGFDTRAYRLEALARTPVFEVDHPATQTEKWKRATRLPPPLAKLSWVPVNFLVDSLQTRLAAAGHEPLVPTAWVWEGVVMYLEDEAVTQTLASVRALSAHGSQLILHYHEPSGSPFQRLLRKVLLSSLSEPQVGQRSRGAMQGFLDRAGFTVVEDLGIGEQASRVGAIAPDTDAARISRILLARPAP